MSNDDSIAVGEVNCESTYWDFLRAMVSGMKAKERTKVARHLLTPEELERLEDWKLAEKL